MGNDKIVEIGDAAARKQIACIDAGTENCPCYLAATGDCLICSRLQGKDQCSCDWRGVCIYSEFIQGNRRVNNPRSDFDVKIARKVFYTDDLVVYILDVGKGFAMKSERPGSYLFLKNKGANRFYDIPISVMDADVENGQVHLAVKIISAKTKALMEENEWVTLRGPYRNGLHGISAIIQKKGKSQKSLIIAKGIGIAPGILTARALRRLGSVDMIVDTDKISEALIDDYLRKEQTDIATMSLADGNAAAELEGRMKKNGYDHVILLVSDYYIGQLSGIVKKSLPAADLAVSNNFKICCGEGLCGSCAVDTSTGDTIKMCKCQMGGENFLEDIFLPGHGISI